MPDESADEIAAALATISIILILLCYRKKENEESELIPDRVEERVYVTCLVQQKKSRVE